MKLNKKIFAGALAGLIAVSSIAVAANERRNLTAYYNIKLNVNGNVFTTTDSTMRPFATSDGRTYISIAGLREAGLVSVAYDNATKTVSVKGADANAAGSAALQAQVASQAAEIARLQYENTQLKAEVEKLKGTSSSSSSSTNTGTKLLSDLSSSDRRTLAKDIQSDIRSLRADTKFDRNQRFGGEVSVDSKSVTLSLYPYSGTFTKDVGEGKEWNEYYKNRNHRSEIEYDYASFVKSEVYDMVKAVLKDYKDYTIYVTVYTDSGLKTKILEADYNLSRNRASATMYEIQ